MSGLVPDADQLGRFARGVFRNASPGGFVSLRAFEDTSSEAVFKIQSVEINGSLDPLIAHAVEIAGDCAAAPAPVVFCPPLATFSKSNTASEAALHEGLTLTVECDQHPATARAKLSAILGPPTFTIASGGEWTNPETGQTESKLHLHWLLKEPSSTPDEHRRLKRMRALACELVGADATSINPVHPIRWPGSVHRKGAARLAQIIDETDTEIDLNAALYELEGIAELRGIGAEDAATFAANASTTLDPATLAACAERIENGAETDWPAWNRIGMAFHRASGGSEAGFAAFDQYSQRSPKYDAQSTKARWAHFGKHPPNLIGAGTLIFEARRSDPEFLRARSGTTEPDSEATEDARSVIKLSDANWNGVVRASASYLRDVVYLRDQVPMILTTAGDAGRPTDAGDYELRGVRYDARTALFVSANAGLTAYHLDERVLFERFARREQQWLPTRCPDNLAKRIIEAAPHLGFHPCSGIVHTPVLINGTIVATPGWHAGTGLYIASPPLSGIPSHPTRGDAEAALETLQWPFRGYGTVDRVALLAASLTAALRASLPTAPGIRIDGNTPGVGKGKLARAWSAIATGRTPAVITEGHNQEETEKRITTTFIMGVPVILLDNIQQHLASSALESALTEGVASIRVFGKLENLKVPTRALVLLTSNNGTVRRDMLRRTLPVRIVVASETPEARAFDFDPVAEAMTNRHHMLAAAFTIARAWWLVRGQPENRQHHKHLGSFEQWAELVGGAVSWLLGRNPVDLIAERKDADPYVAAERAVVHALAEKYSERSWRAADAATDIAPALWTDVLSARRGEDKPTAKAVGHWLRIRRDRVFGQWMLCADPDRNGINNWRLKAVSR